jgi:hypothetical protein
MYVPDVLTVIGAVVGPELHAYVPPPDAVSVTLPPAQKVVAPDTAIAALGSALTVKVATLVVVPDALVIAIVPVVVPAAGVAVICVLLTTVKEAAATPLNLTAVVPVKRFPVIVTTGKLPTQPEVGVKLVIVGTTAFASIMLNISTTVRYARRVPGIALPCLF